MANFYSSPIKLGFIKIFLFIITGSRLRGPKLLTEIFWECVQCQKLVEYSGFRLKIVFHGSDCSCYLTKTVAYVASLRFLRFVICKKTIIAMSKEEIKKPNMDLE